MNKLISLSQKGERPSPISAPDFLKQCSGEQLVKLLNRLKKDIEFLDSSIAQGTFPPNEDQQDSAYSVFAVLSTFFSGFYADLLYELEFNSKHYERTSFFYKFSRRIVKVRDKYYLEYIERFVFFMNECGLDPTPYDIEDNWDAFGDFLFEDCDEEYVDAKITEIEAQFRGWISRNLLNYLEGYTQGAHQLNFVINSPMKVLIRFYLMLERSEDEARKFVARVIREEKDAVVRLAGIKDTTRERALRISDEAYVEDQLSRLTTKLTTK